MNFAIILLHTNCEVACVDYVLTLQNAPSLARTFSTTLECVHCRYVTTLSILHMDNRVQSQQLDPELELELYLELLELELDSELELEVLKSSAPPSVLASFLAARFSRLF